MSGGKGADCGEGPSFGRFPGKAQTTRVRLLKGFKSLPSPL